MSFSRALFLLVLWLPTSVAEAAIQRTFVATTGNDANSCSLVQPCRGLARAITQTLAGGEIIVLDSGGYGAVMIAKSVSIVAPPGVYGGISVSSGSGIVINGAGVNVELHGLTITGLGGAVGIDIQSAANVLIDKCAISGFSGDGLSNVGATTLHIQDSSFRRNGAVGVNLGVGTNSLERVVSNNNDSGGVVMIGGTVTVVDSHLHYNGVGLEVGFPGYAAVVGTTIQHNNGTGVAVTTSASARLDRTLISVNGQLGVLGFSNTETWIVRSTIQDNGQANVNASEVCACEASASVYLTDSAVVRYGTSFALEAVAGSTMRLYSNNAIRGNQTGAGIVSLPLQ